MSTTRPTDATLTEILEAFPSAPIDLDNIGWYGGLMAGELRINRCEDCVTWHHPPGPVCPRCWSDNVVAITVSGRGTVDLVTVLHTGPVVEGIDYEMGHALVAVSLDGVPGVRVTAPMVDCDMADICRGLGVESAVVERAGVPTLVFRPTPRKGN